MNRKAYRELAPEPADRRAIVDGGLRRFDMQDWRGSPLRLAHAIDFSYAVDAEGIVQRLDTE